MVPRLTRSTRGGRHRRPWTVVGVEAGPLDGRLRRLPIDGDLDRRPVDGRDGTAAAGDPGGGRVLGAIGAQCPREPPLYLSAQLRDRLMRVCRKTRPWAPADELLRCMEGEVDGRRRLPGDTD